MAKKAPSIGGKRRSKSRFTVVISDLHHPLHDKKAFKAVLSFIRQNRNNIDNLVLLGDNQDFQNLSRHTENLPGLRTKGGIKKDFDSFSRDVLTVLENAVSAECNRIIFEGNHENWGQQWLEANPAFEGLVDWESNLCLKQRGWVPVRQGKTYRVHKVLFMHGDQNGSGQYVAKKMLEANCCTCVMGHVHTHSIFTKCSQANKQDKWLGVTLPCMTTLSPSYANGRPNAHIVGFGILETFGRKFNLYVPIIIDGEFAFNGNVYSA
jgi:UDP-2,3-diacylglucosamine pyrophosphatase LpxH